MRLRGERGFLLDSITCPCFFGRSRAPPSEAALRANTALRIFRFQLVGALEFLLASCALPLLEQRTPNGMRLSVAWLHLGLYAKLLLSFVQRAEPA